MGLDEGERQGERGDGQELDPREAQGVARGGVASEEDDVEGSGPGGEEGERLGESEAARASPAPPQERDAEGRDERGERDPGGDGAPQERGLEKGHERHPGGGEEGGHRGVHGAQADGLPPEGERHRKAEDEARAALLGGGAPPREEGEGERAEGKAGGEERRGADLAQGGMGREKGAAPDHGEADENELRKGAISQTVAWQPHSKAISTGETPRSGLRSRRWCQTSPV